MAAVVGALRAELSASVAQFTDDMGKSGDQVAKFAKRFDSIGRGMQKASLVMTAAITAPFLAFVGISTRAARESADALGQVEARLKSMGNTSGKSVEGLQASARALMHLSTFDDDDILRNVTANLLTFGNISGNVFDRGQAAAVNMATALKEDLQSATIRIGKAL